MDKIFTKPSALMMSLLQINSALFDTKFYLEEQNEKNINALAYLRNFFSVKNDAITLLVAIIFTYLSANESPISLYSIAEYYELHAVRIYEFYSELELLAQRGYIRYESTPYSESTASFFRVSPSVLQALRTGLPPKSLNQCFEKSSPSPEDSRLPQPPKNDVNVRISKLSAVLDELDTELTHFLTPTVI